MKQKVICQTRRVWRQGGSLAITLPAAFVQAHGIKAGDDVPIVADHILKLIPMPEGREDEERETDRDFHAQAECEKA